MWSSLLNSETATSFQAEVGVLLMLYFQFMVRNHIFLPSSKSMKRAKQDQFLEAGSCLSSSTLLMPSADRRKGHLQSQQWDAPFDLPSQPARFGAHLDPTST